VSRERTKVLYIGGAGRSGSTLLDSMLGIVPGFISCGELRYIWERSFRENQLCGDGVPFREHPFWIEVVNEAFGGFDQVDVDRAIYLQQQIDRLRYIPQYAMPVVRSKQIDALLTEYSGYLKPLYEAIYKVSGCNVIVDSSKGAPYSYMLNTITELDVYMVHFVRDSRAMAHSWKRKKRRPEIHWQEEYMEQFKLKRSTRNWSTNNGFSALFRFVNPRYLFMRYEDFTADPHKALTDILAFVGEEDADISFLEDGRRFQPVPQVSVAGNPMRFKRDEIVIRSDEEWRRKMTKRDQFVATLLTVPLLVYFGYLPSR